MRNPKDERIASFSESISRTDFICELGRTMSPCARLLLVPSGTI